MKTKYIASPELMKAKQVAEYLNRPLLLSGEPGTGKTKFAEFVSDTEEKELFIFNTKSTSVSKDLFYSYDAIAHFADKNQRNILEFISLEALGKAIVNAYGKEKVVDMLLTSPNTNNQVTHLRGLHERNTIVNHFLQDCKGKHSVVLIDEVDKAPRDFPNDILNEIDNLEFDIKELGLHITLRKEDKQSKDKVFVVLTSNFEKNLPEAFLRRCVYHHIEFPENIEELRKIINVHISEANQQQLADRLNEFLGIRSKPGLQKKPATSELIDCIKWLAHNEAMSTRIIADQSALATLLKKNDDLKLFPAIK